MENTGNSMSKDFGGFLWERLTGAGGRDAIVPDIIEEIDPVLEKIFTDAGMPKEAYEKLDLRCDL